MIMIIPFLKTSSIEAIMSTCSHLQVLTALSIVHCPRDLTGAYPAWFRVCQAAVRSLWRALHDGHTGPYRAAAAHAVAVMVAPRIDGRVRRVAALMIQRCLSKAWAKALGAGKGRAAGVLEAMQAKVGSMETVLMQANIEKDSYVKELMMKWYA